MIFLGFHRKNNKSQRAQLRFLLRAVTIQPAGVCLPPDAILPPSVLSSENQNKVNLVKYLLYKTMQLLFLFNR